MNDEIILASASPFRREMLERAGLAFRAEAAAIDERVAEEPVIRAGAAPEDVALVLAEAKALDVSTRHPGCWIIGTDQTLSLGDEILHKPADMDEARRRLLALSGRTHNLNSAVVLAHDGETVWRHVSIARMTMRELKPGFIGRHLARTGEAVLASVGAYQIEGEGIQLFESIEGDLFTIVGLPLLPLLAELRNRGLIDA